MSSDHKLLPCPFCDDARELFVCRTGTGTLSRLFQAHCDNCGAAGPTETDEDEAARAWNARAAAAMADTESTTGVDTGSTGRESPTAGCPKCGYCPCRCAELGLVQGTDASKEDSQ